MVKRWGKVLAIRLIHSIGQSVRGADAVRFLKKLNLQGWGSKPDLSMFLMQIYEMT